MVEYDPRPSRSRREHTLDMLRKTLPWPEDAPQVASSSGGGGDEGRVSGTREEEYFCGEADSDNHAGEFEEGGGEGGRHEDNVSDDDYDADGFAGDDRQDSSPEGGWGERGEQWSSHAGHENVIVDDNAVADRAAAGGGRGVVDCQASGNNRGNGDDDTSSAQGKGDARRHSAGSGGVDSAGKGVNAADGGGGSEEVHTGSPSKPRASPVGGGDDDGERHAVALTAKAIDEIAVREDRGRAGAPGALGPTKRPATGQRKVR